MVEKFQSLCGLDMGPLSQLLDEAGDMTAQPPEPEGGIPRQRLPRFVRWGIRLLFLPFVIIDQWAKRAARFLIPPPFKREGKCKRRGNCCYYITMRQAKGFLGVIQRFWATEINGFYFRTTVPQEYCGRQVYVLGCRYLQKDGSCRHYKTRPSICREWPIIAHFGYPRILKGCGYRPVATKEKFKHLLEHET